MNCEPKFSPKTKRPSKTPAGQNKKTVFSYSEKEKETIKNLTKAWNAFVAMYHSYNEDELDNQSCHPDDVDEFRHGIHHLQHIIATRAMRRVDPKTWPNYPLMVENMKHEL